MKPIIKKVIIPLTCALVIGTSLYTVPQVKYEDYSTKQQTVDLQDSLDAVSGYTYKGKMRLEHNNGEPMYVEIDKDFTEEQRNEIISVLDHVFGIVGSVNENYKYEIVDSDSKLANKASISFDIKSDKIFNDINEANGLDVDRGEHARAGANPSLSLFSYSKKGAFFKKCDILYSPEAVSERESYDFYRTTLHETLHAFGIDDIYGEESMYRNTFISTENNTSWLSMVSPNDYKLLISMYAEDMTNMSEEEKQAYIAKLNKKVEEYSVEYFRHYKQAYKDCLISNGITEEQDLKNYISQGQIDKDVDIIFEKFWNLEEQVVKGRLKVKGDKYVLALYDENDKVLEHCSGKAHHLGDQIFLQGAQFKNFKDTEQSFSDLFISIICYLDDEPVYSLRDTTMEQESLYSQHGVNIEYYNQQNQGLSQ